MVLTEQQLVQWMVSFMGICGLETMVIVLVKRDIKMGLKKWWLTKMGKVPIKVRIHDSAMNVKEYIIATKGAGESIEIKHKQSLMAKLKGEREESGETYFLNPKCIRRCDDQVNEISYSIRSTMPIDPMVSPEESKQEERRFVQAFNDARAKRAKETGETYVPINENELLRFTDPKRLNRFIDFNYLSAKADALKESQQIEKWVKWAFFAACAATLMGVVTWYTLDGKALPLLQQIASTVSNFGSTVLPPHP